MAGAAMGAARCGLYLLYDNKLTEIADLKVAQALCAQFTRRTWPRLLKAFAKRVNPWLPRLRRAGLRDYTPNG